MNTEPGVGEGGGGLLLVVAVVLMCSHNHLVPFGTSEGKKISKTYGDYNKHRLHEAARAFGA